jgi:hypothetical protein
MYIEMQIKTTADKCSSKGNGQKISLEPFMFKLKTIPLE